MRLARLPNGEPEIFTTIQGEGPSTGVPSIFVRLSLCNLHCDWCDTRHTWDWANYDPRTEILHLEAGDVAARVLGADVANVVFTGGEPLLQARELAAVAGAVAGAGRRIEVETNGTIAPPPELAPHVTQWNVSPKLANSGNTADERESAGALAWFAAQPGAFFKFVVADPEDVDEVRALVERHGLPTGRVILMPEGTDAATLSARAAWLVPLCVACGYRFSTRLHVLLWGDERGR